MQIGIFMQFCYYLDRYLFSKGYFAGFDADVVTALYLNMPPCVLFQLIISLVYFGFCDNHNTGNNDGKTERICLACYFDI